MPTPALSRLQKVPIRDVWPTEPQGFTPWLASSDNLPLLGEAIGIRLELQSTEESVGKFRADIVCKSLPDGNLVLIENQLAQTDHMHLGQILTYTAGLEAVTVVWIAEAFQNEHRAAIDWLNEKTPDNINFFGLEIELWRIADSPVAPKFNVVCKPNEWTRSVIKSRENSDSKQFCLDYWSGVLNALRPSGILKETAKPYGRQDTYFDVGWQTFVLKAYFSRPQKCGAAWITCRGPRGLENFEKIKASKSQIEQSIGRKLTWHEDADGNRGSCSFELFKFDVDNTADWPRQHQMFAEALLALHRVVGPIVKSLDILE